jgi:hypothetical protein
MEYPNFLDLNILICDHSSIFYISNRVSRLIWFGVANGGIEKMRSIFFQRSKYSDAPVMQPAGWGGESSKLANFNLLAKYYRQGTTPSPFQTLINY